MSLTSASVEMQRRKAVRDDVPSWRRHGLVRDAAIEPLRGKLGEGFISSSFLARVVFFLLTLVGASALGGLFQLVGVGLSVAGLALIVLAELFIRGRRLFQMGVEEALWAAGVSLLIAGLPGKGSEEVILLFAAAFALAGWRTATSLEIAAVPVLAIVYVALKGDGPIDALPIASLLFAILTLFVSLSAAFEMSRPFVDSAARILTVIGGPLAWALLLFESRYEQLQVVYAVALFLWMLALGIRQRCHAHLLAALLLGGIVCYEIGQHSDMRVDAQFVLFGAAALVASFLLHRLLRRAPRGFTSEPLKESAMLDMAQLAAGAMAREAGGMNEAPAAAPAHAGGGGEFGGAGASGEY